MGDRKGGGMDNEQRPARRQEREVVGNGLTCIGDVPLYTERKVQLNLIIQRWFFFGILGE